MSAWDFEDRKDEESAPDAAAAAPDEDQTQPVEEPQDAKAAEAPQAEVAPEASPEEDEPLSMDDVDLDAVGPAALKPNAIVRGVVAAVTEDGVLVDVGGKAEGIVPIYEFLDRSEMPERDDEIEVAVVKLQDEDGLTILSKKRADYERVWNRVVEAMETGEIVDAMVTDRVKGGLRVDLGVAGFVPASHVATRDVRNLDRFVGRSLRLKVLEADRDRKKVVLSHRMVVEEERQERRAETLARLQEGLVCEGKVRNITEYGAFIDLGGVDGLLHVSEMSWGRIEHPSDVCSVGDTLRVVVLEIDTDRDRISLGRRQILPDPWKEVGKELRPGSMVRGKVSRIVRTGAFIDLADFEVEGFLPVGELSEKRIDSPSEVIEEGQELELKVLKLRPQARRLTLSLAAALEEKERQEYQKYMADQDEPKTTLGDQFADVLGAVAAEMDEDEAAEEPAAEEPVAEEPVAEEPVAEEPVAEEPVAEEPVAEEPVVEEPVAEEPVAEEPVAEEPVAEEPVAEEPVAEEPVAEEPVAEEPVAEEPVAEAESAEEPAEEESAAEEEAAEEEKE